MPDWKAILQMIDAGNVEEVIKHKVDGDMSNIKKYWEIGRETSDYQTRWRIYNFLAGYFYFAGYWSTIEEPMEMLMTKRIQEIDKIMEKLTNA